MLNAPKETAATATITLTAREEFLIAAPLFTPGQDSGRSHFITVWFVLLNSKTPAALWSAQAESLGQKSVAPIQKQTADG
jgi:hypothetical protein